MAITRITTGESSLPQARSGDPKKTYFFKTEPYRFENELDSFFTWPSWLSRRRGYTRNPFAIASTCLGGPLSAFSALAELREPGCSGEPTKGRRTASSGLFTSIIETGLLTRVACSPWLPAALPQQKLDRLSRFAGLLPGS
jgi:hypothetical protein